jgi:hypothetical protein
LIQCGLLFFFSASSSRILFFLLATFPSFFITMSFVLSDSQATDLSPLFSDALLPQRHPLHELHHHKLRHIARTSWYLFFLFVFLFFCLFFCSSSMFVRICHFLHRFFEPNGLALQQEKKLLVLPYERHLQQEDETLHQSAWILKASCRSFFTLLYSFLICILL